jgi:glycine/D-amino acid oxidase-like deaminating enzyme
MALDCVVIGGGIAGLAAAYELRSAGRRTRSSMRRRARAA